MCVLMGAATYSAIAVREVTTTPMGFIGLPLDGGNQVAPLANEVYNSFVDMREDADNPLQGTRLLSTACNVSTE